jgi:glycogen debranching enzyme
VTWSALAPLALPDLPDEIGRRMVDEHLLDPDQFWLPVPLPSVSAADPSFTLDDKGLFGDRRYWRGPTWVNSGWLVWLGLKRLGYESQATELVNRLATAMAGQPLREYYDPYTGAGMGTTDFGWSALIVDMLADDPRASTSYVEGAVSAP